MLMVNTVYNDILYNALVILFVNSEDPNQIAQSASQSVLSLSAYATKAPFHTEPTIFFMDSLRIAILSGDQL